MDHGTITREYDQGLTSGRGGNGDVIPIFSHEAVYNETKSLATGRPYYDTLEMLTIIIPGDPASSPQRYVTEADKHRFSEAYQAFVAQKELVFEGTVLENWPRLTTGQVYSLKALGIHTVEHIANLSDANVPKLGMGGLMLRDQAKAYIEAAARGGTPERLVVENARLRDDMTLAMRTIDELKVQIETLARKSGADISAMSTQMDLAQSHARETIANQPGDLPSGWESMKTRELIDLCAALEFATSPRNKDEAVSLLTEYQARRNTLKKSN